MINLAKVLWFFDTFFKEHDFRNFLKVKFVFYGEPFEPDFGGIRIFIFGLDFDILEDI